jgi:hypothetical protein
VWADVDNVWEQEKLVARKMLENAAESHTSGARCVGTLLTLDSPTSIDSQHCQHFLVVSMGSVYPNMSKKRSSHLLLVVILRHNWHIGKKRLKYQVAFVRFWQSRNSDK